MTAAKTHLSLNVRDVDASTRWYEAFFGQTAHKRHPGYANFDIENPGLKLALQEAPDKACACGPLNHLGILVASTDDVLAAKERLETAGLVTFSEENVTCCYARQDKIWVRDPDGNAWEVYALLDDMLDDHSHEEVGACCSDKEACCAGAPASACC